jgi:hypothetical protein
MYLQTFTPVTLTTEMSDCEFLQLDSRALVCEVLTYKVYYSNLHQYILCSVFYPPNTVSYTICAVLLYGHSLFKILYLFAPSMPKITAPADTMMCWKCAEGGDNDLIYGIVQEFSWSVRGKLLNSK